MRDETQHRPGTVQLLLTQRRQQEPGHELREHEAVARRLAHLKGLVFGGVCAFGDRPSCAYLVPVDTLVGVEGARSLGVWDENDLFGGVVPHAFVATKAITHPLVSPDADRPEGWSDAFSRRVGNAVLHGYTAFSRGDRREGAARLLERGGVRIKPVLGRGGLGQFVARDMDELEQQLDKIEVSLASGLVLEEDLADVITYSVGEVKVAGMVISYYGTQHLTRDNTGASAYGGSDLVVFRGGLRALTRSGIPENVRIAIEQARVYDAAAYECFPGFLASRRNYDIAQGTDASGNWRSGVLEQSWRIGGASTAEIVALEAFRADPNLTVIRASAVEAYGKDARAPQEATIFYHGQDAEVGPILKYALTEPP